MSRNVPSIGRVKSQKPGTKGGSLYFPSFGSCIPVPSYEASDPIHWCHRIHGGFSWTKRRADGQWHRCPASAGRAVRRPRGRIRRVRKASRPSDPLGQLTLREAILVEGEAAQTSTLRWQDYTQTAIDPSDDCTIWYVGDYLKKDASSYSTRIGAFRLPGCAP